MSYETDWAAIVMLIENNFEEFVSYCPDEDVADDTLKAIMREAGMATE